MIKNILLGAAVLGIAAPSFAKPPIIALGQTAITSNISCRIRARTKFFELGATQMAAANANGQWAHVNGLSAFVWCNGSQAIIVASGDDHGPVNELRDELMKF